MFVRIRTYYSKQETGQVLIQVAVMMVVLLGFVALAVDVGNVYSERRRMQNAADAGALAGARALCLPIPTPSVAPTEAARYMKNNGVPVVAIADVKVSGNVVNTTARKTANTFFAAFAGFPTLDVKAEASAACGAATSACGLWPIAFEKSMWNDVVGASCKDALPFVAWDAENEQQQVSCVINNQSRPICDCYDCNLDKKGGDDFRVVTGTSRGWLDFSVLTEPPYVDECGCGDLKCRFEKGSASKITLPGCVPGIPGTKWSIKSAIDQRIGDAVNIALFDSTGCTATKSCANSKDTYHVTSFACVNVVGWKKANEFKLDPKPTYLAANPTAKPISSKVIIMSANCDNACATSCGSTDGSLPQPWGLKAVSLIK